MDRVSVIIPTYNCEAYIAETLSSVLGQDHDKVEILVVDDGSTDATCDIVREHAGVQLIQQRNAGVCAARNHGIRLAQGDYICCLDHDDFWLPDKLSSQLQVFQSRPEAGLVYTAFTLWHRDASGDFPSPASLAGAGTGTAIDEDMSGWIYHHLLLDCWILTSTAMIRREVLERLGGFDESLPYSEDWDLWLRIARHYPMAKLAGSSTLYRQHPQQGNRRVRDIDYRTRLLAENVREYGLSSRDGRELDRRQFRHRLGRYHAEYGFSQLQGGHRGAAARAMIAAWRCHPTRLRYLAYLAAGTLGWKPQW